MSFSVKQMSIAAAALLAAAAVSGCETMNETSPAAATNDASARTIDTGRSNSSSSGVGTAPTAGGAGGGL